LDRPGEYPNGTGVTESGVGIWHEEPVWQELKEKDILVQISEIKVQLESILKKLDDYLGEK
jgi:hypothetical protein